MRNKLLPLTRLRNITSVVAIGISITIVDAQPVITSEWSPVIGDIFTFKSDKQSEKPVIKTGPDQTWDFTQLTINGFEYTSTHTVIPDSLSTVFPKTTLMKRISDEYSYFSADDSGFYEHGKLDPFSLMINANSKTILIYPLTFNTSFTDSFASDYFIEQRNTYHVPGITHALVDGYGTLITSSGTFYDVLKIKKTETSAQYKLGPTGQVLKKIDVITITHLWMSPHFRGQWLLSMEQEIINGAAMPFVLIKYATNPVSGIYPTKSNTLEASVYPNPAKGKIYADITLKENADLTLALYDLAGKQVHIQMYPALASGVNTVSFETDHLQPGMYFVHMSDNKQHTGTYKILVSP